MSEPIFAIEDGDGAVVSVGYESLRDAQEDANDSTDGGRARIFACVGDLREQYPDSWLDQYDDSELRPPYDD